MKQAHMNQAFLAALLMLATAGYAAAESGLPEENAALRQEALSDDSPGAQVQDSGVIWTLLSGEENGRLLGRISWATPSYSQIFAVEASATLQKGASEVDLLNLDGLAGGDASIKGKWTYSYSWDREGEKDQKGQKGQETGGDQKTEEDRYGKLCKDINSELEKEIAAKRRLICTDGQTNCEEADLSIAMSTEYAPLSNRACTFENLLKLSDWKQEALTQQCAVVQAGYDKLATLDETSAYPSADLRHFGIRNDVAFCDKVDFPMIAREAKSRLESRLVAQTTNDTERKHIKQALEDEIFKDPQGWLDKKSREKLEPLCKSYNKPDRSAQLRVVGEGQECYTSKIAEAISKIDDKRMRNSFQKRYIKDLPVGIWFLTFSAGASTEDFEYIDPDAIKPTSTFSELKTAVQEEAREDTTIGLAWSTQRGNHFFSLGYELRNKYKGAGSADLCAPTEEGSNVARCFETTAGAPTKIEQDIGLLEWRTYLAPSLGLKLRAFWIDKDVRRKMELGDEWELQATLYFLQHKDKGLNGGLDVAYDTAFGELSARVFIGQSFNLFD